MSIINFPSNPSNGDEYTAVGRTWRYNAKGWVQKSGPTRAFTFAPTAPVNPQEGDEWMDSDTGVVYKWIIDEDSGQWVRPVAGIDGTDGLQGPPGLDAHGPMFIVETAEPPDYLGENYDFYIDSLTGKLYEKQSNLWVFRLQPGTREVLQAVRTYYVRTDGSDSNTGLEDSAAGAFLTLQRAINVALSLDGGGFSVTIQIKDGTYTAGGTVSSRLIGGGTLIIRGNASTEDNVVLSVTGGTCLTVGGGALVAIGGFKMTTITSGYGIVITDKSRIDHISGYGGLNFGAMVNDHMHIRTGSVFSTNSANYRITGGAARHVFCYDPGSTFLCDSLTITLTGTPAFSVNVFELQGLSYAEIASVTFSGSATGTRYFVGLNSIINTGGGGATYLPGSVNGSAATGGQYV